MDLETLRVWRQAQAGRCLEVAIVGGDSFDLDRRREGVAWVPLRIDHGDAAGGGKPEPTIGRAGGSRIGRPLSRKTAQAVGGVENHPFDPRRRGRERLIQLPLLDPEDPERPAQPQVAVVVLQDSRDGAARKSVGTRQRDEPILSQSAQTAFAPDQDVAFTIVRDHHHVAAAKAVLRRVQARRGAFEDDDVAVLEAQPHASEGVLMQDPAAVRREDRMRAQVRPLFAVPSQDSPCRAAGRDRHPQIASLVLGDCLDHRSLLDARNFDV